MKLFTVSAVQSNRLVCEERCSFLDTTHFNCIEWINSNGEKGSNLLLFFPVDVWRVPFYRSQLNRKFATSRRTFPVNYGRVCVLSTVKNMIDEVQTSFEPHKFFGDGKIFFSLVHSIDVFAIAQHYLKCSRTNYKLNLSISMEQLKKGSRNTRKLMLLQTLQSIWKKFVRIYYVNISLEFALTASGRAERLRARYTKKALRNFTVFIQPQLLSFCTRSKLFGWLKNNARQDQELCIYATGIACHLFIQTQ